jgi:hypothetical protein
MQMTPEELAEYDANSRTLIDQAEIAVSESEANYLAAKETASEAKKELEADEGRLRKLIRERRDQRGRKPDPTLLDHAGKSEADTDTALEAPGDGIPEDLYKQYSIAEWTKFGLTEKDVEKLSAGDLKSGGTAPIRTIGDLQTFSQPNPDQPTYTRNYTDIKGIGQAGADRISEAETNFWGWWQKGGKEEFAKEKGYGVQAVAGGTEADGEPVDGAEPDGEDAGRTLPEGEIALVGVGTDEAE